MKNLYSIINSVRNPVYILIWSIVIIFPVAGAARLLPGAYNFYTWVAKPEWVHILAHMILFGIFGLLFSTMDWLPREFWKYILIVIVLGLLQEGFQNITSTSGPQTIGQMSFDWFVDILSGTLGWWISRRFISRKMEPDA